MPDDKLPAALRGMWVICDLCRLKRDASNAREFVREHLDHVFTGLRVMAMDFPCPNAQRDYAEDTK